MSIHNNPICLIAGEVIDCGDLILMQIIFQLCLKQQLSSGSKDYLVQIRPEMPE
jgi:hypothetical protein